MIRKKAEECHLSEEVKEKDFANFEEYMGELHNFITDLKNMQISVGLHIIGAGTGGRRDGRIPFCPDKIRKWKSPLLG